MTLHNTIFKIFYVSFHFSLSTNLAAAGWTKPVTIWNTLYKKQNYKNSYNKYMWTYTRYIHTNIYIYTFWQWQRETNKTNLPLNDDIKIWNRRTSRPRQTVWNDDGQPSHKIMLPPWWQTEHMSSLLICWLIFTWHGSSAETRVSKSCFSCIWHSKRDLPSSKYILAEGRLFLVPAWASKLLRVKVSWQQLHLIP